MFFRAALATLVMSSPVFAQGVEAQFRRPADAANGLAALKARQSAQEADTNLLGFAKVQPRPVVIQNTASEEKKEDAPRKVQRVIRGW